MVTNRENKGCETEFVLWLEAAFNIWKKKSPLTLQIENCAALNFEGDI